MFPCSRITVHRQTGTGRQTARWAHPVVSLEQRDILIIGQSRMNLLSLQRQCGMRVSVCVCVCNSYSRSRLIRRKQSDLALHTAPPPPPPPNPDWRNNYTSRSNVCCVVLWLLLCRFVRFARFIFHTPPPPPTSTSPLSSPPSSLLLLRCPIRAFCFVVGHTHIHAHAHREIHTEVT